jgi:hypothetical protein
MPQLGGMPSRGSGPKRVFDWTPVVELLKQNPNVDLLADELTGVENLHTLRNAVRQGSVNILRLMGGTIIPTVRDSFPDESARGGRRGNLWLRWEPERSPEGYYDSVYLERDQRISRLTGI